MDSPPSSVSVMVSSTLGALAESDLICSTNSASASRSGISSSSTTSSTGRDSSSGTSSITDSSVSSGCREAIRNRSGTSPTELMAILAKSEALGASFFSSRTARFAVVGPWLGSISCAFSNAGMAFSLSPRFAWITPRPYQAEALRGSISVALE